MKRSIITIVTILTLLISSLGFSEVDTYKSSERSIRLPNSVDHSGSKYLPEVGDQGYINSSVEWALGYYLRTYQQAKDFGWDIKDENGNDRRDRVFSPSFIYNQINNGINVNSSIKDVVNILKLQGTVTLENFDENDDYRKKPDNKTMLSAYPHRIAEYRSIDLENTSPESVIRLVKESLVLEDLPVLGVNTGRNWKYLQNEGGRSFITSYKELSEKTEHTVIIVGYDDSIITPEGRGAFKIINSWGKDWGDDGFAYITYEAFKEHAYSLGFIEDLKNKEKPVESIKDIQVEMLSSREAKYTWKPSLNATGYYIYDEENNIIDTVYAGSQHVEILSNNKIKTRYVQAFNAVFESEKTEFKVDPTKYDSENKVDYDRDGARKIDTVIGKDITENWTISFSRDVLYGEYLKKNIFIVDENNYIKDITIDKTSDANKLKIICPKSAYKQGEKYTIVIKDVLDIKGNVLKENTIMDFTVK